MNKMEKIDLHLHTNVSDGKLSPSELVKMCIAEGCSKIAITDHDKINDYQNYSDIYGIPIISGIEFNSSTSGMHLLGYGIKNIDRVQKIMNEIEMENQDICYRVIDALYADSYDISVEQVLSYINSLGISIDYLNKKHIVKYLIYKEYVREVLQAYNELIGVGQKYYYPIKKLTKYEILDIIKSNGGVAVLAHPSTLKLDDIKLESEVIELMNYGLDGIEVINRSVTYEQSIKYRLLADKLDLLWTVGTDFHTPFQDKVGVEVPTSVFDRLHKKIKLLNN